MLAKNEFEMPHTITYYECDPTEKLSIDMLINLIMSVSEEQSRSLAVDTKVVAKIGGGWVITNYELQLTDLPAEGDHVILGTRTTAYNKYFAFREFWLKNETGDELVHINGMFVFMDFATRKMAAIPNAIIEPFSSKQVKKIPRIDRPQKLDTEAIDTKQDYRVRYFDIDSNQHVNNAHYFSWMLDALPADFLKHHQLTKMTIKFEREVRYGQTINSQVSQPQPDGDKLFTNHQIELDGDIHAQANCWWQ